MSQDLLIDGLAGGGEDSGLAIAARAIADPATTFVSPPCELLAKAPDGPSQQRWMRRLGYRF